MQMSCAQNAYTRSMVDTSTPLNLIIMLYDGAIEYLSKVIFYMNQGNVSQKIHYISRTIAIIEELLSSLKLEVGGEVAVNLQELYLYMLRELTIANAKNDAVRVEHIEDLLKDLRDSWRKLR